MRCQSPLRSSSLTSSMHRWEYWDILSNITNFGVSMPSIKGKQCQAQALLPVLIINR